MVLALSAALVACRRPPAPTPRTGPGEFETQAVQVQQSTPDQRPWFCTASGHGTPPSGHGNGSHVHPFYEGKTKGPLGWADCLALARQLDVTVSVTRGLETKAKAEAAGWVQVAPYIPGLGTHHIKLFSGAGTAPFDPAKPTNLVFGGSGPDAPLVGVAYSHFSSGAPPEAYAGGNDWWHLHDMACTGAQIQLGEDLSSEECVARGGTPVTMGSGVWLLHLWPFPPYEYRPDLFVSGHPCLLADGIAPQSDPCWQTAHGDAAETTPGTVPGGHGEHGH